MPRLRPSCRPGPARVLVNNIIGLHRPSHPAHYGFATMPVAIPALTPTQVQCGHPTCNASRAAGPQRRAPLARAAPRCPPRWHRLSLYYAYETFYLAWSSARAHVQMIWIICLTNKGSRALRGGRGLWWQCRCAEKQLHSAWHERRVCGALRRRSAEKAPRAGHVHEQKNSRLDLQ